MTDKDRLKKIEEFIKSHELAVISTTTSKGLPEAAVIGFSEKDNFELIFGTFESSRKYQNLKLNPNVALVIGWEEGKTVQYEGSVEELAGDELEECKRIHLVKMPSAAKYANDREERFFKIIPKWIKYSDLSVDPWDMHEIKF